MKNNNIDRVKMVKAMEFICRQINNEDIFMRWLYAGVADGDIEYGDMEYNPDFDDYYIKVGVIFHIEDGEFADLMKLFLRLMKQAYNDGGLYCGGVVSA